MIAFNVTDICVRDKTIKWINTSKRECDFTSRRTVLGI